MARGRQTDLLSHCLIDLVAYTTLFKKSCAITQPAFEQVNTDLHRLMDESAQKMAGQKIDPRDYDEARFAICAWIDETILNSPWMHRQQWQGALLQSEFYNTVNAGSEFYEHLNQLHAEQNNVREIYYLCLGFGFMGRFSMGGDAFLLEQLKKSNLRSLTGKVSEPLAYTQEIMFPGAYPPQAEERGGMFNRGLKSARTGIRMLLWSTPLIVIVVLYLIFMFVLGGVVDNFMLHVREG